jgi:hypothetical protein
MKKKKAAKKKKRQLTSFTFRVRFIPGGWPKMPS